MNDMQIIRSPSGDELVVIPRAEYEALVAAATAYAEDQDDVAIHDVIKVEERDRMTREGMADVDSGRVIDHTAVRSWAASLDTDKPLPVPHPR